MIPFSSLFAEGQPSAPKRAGIYDPRGWGRCVCPLFEVNDETAKGTGTGFFIQDLLPAGVTAEHLVDIERLELPDPQSSTLDLSGMPYGLTAILPHQMIIFGTVRIPQKYCQPVKSFAFDVVPKDDPMVHLRGRTRFTRRSDTMFLAFPDAAELPPNHCLPTVSLTMPQPGDLVCAVGFPEIRTFKQKSCEVYVPKEGMAVSYAKVIQVVPERGQYEKSPIAIVESDWPGGMSGGPVFDRSGSVVGVVSRELPGAAHAPSRGTFTLLRPVLEHFIRTTQYPSAEPSRED